MIWILCFVAVYVFGLKHSRKLRARSFDVVRIMGDVIALRNGTYIQRLIRKRMHKATGSTINKMKVWK